MAFTVYCLTNQVSGKKYIGQTVTLDRRLRQHKSGHSGCRALKSAIRKYGWDSFTATILASATSADEIDALEIKYISELKTLSPDGYNLAGGGRVPRELSPETRRRKSESAKAVGISQACREASLTPEAREKRSTAAKKRGISQVCRDAQKKAVTGRPITPEHRANLGSAWRGKQRPRHSEFMKNQYSNDSVRAAHSERMTLWWAERKTTCSS